MRIAVFGVGGVGGCFGGRPAQAGGGGVYRPRPASAGVTNQKVLAVAHARGVALPAGALRTVMAQLDRPPPEATVSMQRDVLARCPSKLEAQIGAVVRLGQEVRVPTPLYTLIYGSLLPLELQVRGQVQFSG